MLSLHSQAMINSFAWPLLDFKAMESRWDGEWTRIHDDFLQNKFPQLGRDEIVQIRCLAWPPTPLLKPSPREAAARLAHLFTEVRGGRVILKTTVAPQGSFSHFLQSQKNNWIPPESTSDGWLYASRLIQPTILVAYWCHQADNHPGFCSEGVSSGYNQLEALWRSGLGDYHVHQAAAIPQDHFFPLLPLLADCWEGLRRQLDSGTDEWTPVDRGEFARLSHINFLLLILAHGGLAWLLLPNADALKNASSTLIERYWQNIVSLLDTTPPKTTREALDNKIGEIFQKLKTVENSALNLAHCTQGGAGKIWVSSPAPYRRDRWVNGVALCRIWRLLDQENRQNSTTVEPRFLLFDRMLWLRNFIFRLFAQSAGTPGFANFKVWFGRTEYIYAILEYMRSFQLEKHNLLQENVKAVNNRGRIERIEFRSSFSNNEKIFRITNQYISYVKNKSTKITFSQQLIKDEDDNQPDGICRLDGKKSKDQPKTIRYCTLIRKFAGDVSNTVEFAKRHPEILLLIRGLDTVNHERRTPNWVPGLVYLFYNDSIEAAYKNAAKDHWTPPPYRHTFHAGEDFWLPSDGLRAIFDLIHFKLLRRDDRIGHALLLGLDLKTWAGRSESRVTRLGTLFDDLVWEWKLLRLGAISGNATLVEEEIVQTMQKMKQFLGNPPPLAHLDNQNDFESLWQAYQLRYDYNRLKQWKLVGGNVQESWFDDFSRSQLRKFSQFTKKKDVCLYYEYLSDHNLWQAWEQGCLVSVDPQRIDRWLALQGYVFNQVVKSSIIVESCPSSNVLISGVNSYADHSIFQMAPPDGSGRLLVCLNTDDPITFSQNVCEEYHNLYRAAIEKNISPPEALRWLEGIKAMGLNASFLPNDLDYPERDTMIKKILRNV